MASTWIGTLDVMKWTQSLLNDEMTGVTQAANQTISALTKTQTTLTKQLNNYSQLQNLLNSLFTAVQALPASFAANYTVSSSNTAVATASVQTGQTVASATHSITVTSLAQAEQRQTSIYASSTAALNVTDPLTIAVGSSNFSVNVGTSDTLTTIASAINSGAATNNMAVRADVVPVFSGGTTKYQLIVSSTQTGAANSVTVTEGGPGSLGFSQLTAGADAVFTWDGLNMTSASNSNIPIGALSVNLLTGANSTANLIVNAGNQSASATSAIQGVVSAYNAVDQFIETTQASTTSPDMTLSSILSYLQSAMAKSVGSPPYNTLDGVGVIQNTSTSPITITMPNGKTINYTPHGEFTINLDSTKGTTLATALANNFSAVQTLFTDQTNGINTTLNKLLTPNTGSIWKSLNAPGEGVAQVNDQLTTVQNQIADENLKVQNQQAALVLKYGKLSLSLQQLQLKSQYMTQQIQMLGH